MPDSGDASRSDFRAAAVSAKMYGWRCEGSSFRTHLVASRPSIRGM